MVNNKSENKSNLGIIKVFEYKMTIKVENGHIVILLTFNTSLFHIIIKLTFSGHF